MLLADRDLTAEVLDALDSGLIVLDAERRVIAWNAWMTWASGLSADEARHRPLQELFPHQRLGRLGAAIDEALEVGASGLLTHTLHPSLLPLKTRAGRALIHDVAVRPVGEKPFKRCVVQIADVTTAAERERVLRQRQNARYDAVVESAPDPILTFDSEGLIQLANPAAAQEFGYSRDELVGQPLAGFLQNPDAWEAAWPAVLAGRPVAWPLELVVRRRDGSASYVDASASRWLSDARVYVTAILRDVNQRRAAESQLRQLNETLEERVRERTAELERAHEQLRQSQKMEAIGQLTGGVAHDFNNLLTPILGGLDVVKRRGMTDARALRLIEGALQSAERARILVQRLLAFARRQPLQATAVDVTSLVQDMTDLLASTLGPRVRVVVDVPDGLPPALADRNQLEMALLNLAVNARDAMEDGGTLTVSARAAEAGPRGRLRPGRYVRLAVSDTGSGMSPETLSRAVEPFFSTKGVGKGTGLGLSMIHGLAAQLGGTLELSSTPGVGTTVEMWLPVARTEASDTPTPAAEEVAPGAGVVLLVDDEDLIRTSTAHMLADLGYAVVEASSARAALRLLDDAHIDLIITDHLMPGMTGTELARQAQAQRPSLPVLIISGYADLEDVAPDLPRLTKPFLEAELATALATLARSGQAEG
ncbi:hybrid sensor histidine kinase/response regulator [Phenylobacterium sp.]|uniref:hybrid sensor histidine kinase/response regulator n=1 Tax=Phenylobacterium sp. TaxID=1871053 RepID=UPI002FE17708